MQDSEEIDKARVGPGVRARELRKAKGLTIAEVARGAKLGTGALCDFENGKRSFRTDSLIKLAEFLDVQPSALLDA